MSRLDRLLRLVRAARDAGEDARDEELLRRCTAEGVISEAQASAIRERLLESELEGRAARAAELIGLRRIARYVVRREVARGGMGIVYEAEDPDLRRRVALKVLRDDRASDAVLKRLHREASIVAQLRHPNIVTVHEVGTARDGDRALSYIAMDYVDGRTFADVLADRAAPRAELLRILEDVARAVDHAHSRGVVHRDLKPGNVLVETGGRAVLTDFGLARAPDADKRLTLSHDVLGTPHYMSPEQVRGRTREADARADVWGLGVMLYEAVAGRRPFEGRTPAEVYESILGTDPKSLESADADIVCQKALDKDPAQRYATAAEFADDVARLRRNEPVLARRASVLHRLMRKASRHRAALALASVALAAAAVVLVQAWRAGAHASELRELAVSAAAVLDRKNELRHLRMEPEEARRRLDEAVRSVRGPEPQASYVRARGRFYLADIAGAEREIRAALALHPEFRPGWALLGIVKIEDYLRRGTGELPTIDARLRALRPVLDEAIAALDRGWPPGREEEEARRWGLAWTTEERVLTVAARAIRLHFGNDRTEEARTLLEEALRDVRAEELANLMGHCVPDADALAWHSRAVEWAPGYERARLDRALERSRRGDHDGAIQDCAMAARIDPRSWPAWVNRGNAHRAKGDFEAAVAAYTEALRIKPDVHGARLNRGAVLVALGRTDAACEDFEEILRREPNHAGAHANRGLLRAQAGDTDGAFADYAEALRLHPLDAFTLHNRAKLRDARGDAAGAIADCSEALRIEPRLADTLLLRAKAHAATGALDAAIADLDAAISLKPPSANLLQNRGLLRRLRGDAAGAVADLTEALRIEPGDAESHYQRGLAHAARGERDAAAADYREALAAAPKDWPRRAEVERLLGR